MRRSPPRRSIVRPGALWLSLTVAAAGCGGDTTAAADAGDGAAPDAFADVAATSALVPASGPASGYFAVVIDLGAEGIAAADAVSVHVGGIAAYGLTVVDPTHLEVTVQGHAAPGAQPVVVTTAAGETTLAARFTYEAPPHPKLARVWAFGASLGQGVQQGTPTLHGGLMSPPAQIARQLGAYMPLPLLKEGLFPQLEPGDVGPPPACAIPDIADFVKAATNDIVPLLTDETGALELAKARVDPSVVAQNVSVGGSKVRDEVHGPAADNLGYTIVGAMVHEPGLVFPGPISRSQLEILEEAEPTLILSVDFYGNDVIADGLNLATVTPEEELFRDLAELVERLAATGAEVFLPTLPAPHLMPRVIDHGRARIAAGETAAEVASDLATLDARAASANAEVVRLASLHENVHVVDVAAVAAGIEAAGGVAIGDRTLTLAKLGGIVGLDGVHFTDVGYAIVANAYIAKIGEVLGLAVPPIDLAPIAAADPGSPAAMDAAGLDPTACDRGDLPAR